MEGRVLGRIAALSEAMVTRWMKIPVICVFGLLVGPSTPRLAADTFGSGVDAFSIEFVNIGNAGNANDVNSTWGGVPYNYRIGVTEVPQDWIDKATNLGLANVSGDWWTGNQPAGLTWYEAAAFVNFLNTSTGHQRAYDLTFSGGGWSMALWSRMEDWEAGGDNRFRHKDAYYFLPNIDEWYKAAFHKNDGVTGNYWDYATGSDTIFTAVSGGTTVGTAVYGGVGNVPADVDNNGGLSPYGTRGQNGNWDEWIEGAPNGLNDDPSGLRLDLGGDRASPELYLRAGFYFNAQPTLDGPGLRVASIPEPSAATLLMGAAFCALGRRKR